MAESLQADQVSQIFAHTHPVVFSLLVATTSVVFFLANPYFLTPGTSPTEALSASIPLLLTTGLALLVFVLSVQLSTILLVAEGFDSGMPKRLRICSGSAPSQAFRKRLLLAGLVELSLFILEKVVSTWNGQSHSSPSHLCPRGLFSHPCFQSSLLGLGVGGCVNIGNCLIAGGTRGFGGLLRGLGDIFRGKAHRYPLEEEELVVEEGDKQC